MKHAISMYRAGMIVSASEADYSTAKDLGLICPLCSEAVFWRRGHIRKRGRAIWVSPRFCHYPGGDPQAFDCDARAKTKAGRDEIMRLQIESHNQRLEVYNKHLWDMFKADRNLKRDRLLKIRKAVGDAWIDTTWRLCQKELRRDIALATQQLAEYLQSPGELTEEFLRGRASEETLEALQEQQEYFAGIDQRLHMTICTEILEFLGTRTGGYAFRHIFTACLIPYFLASKSDIHSLKREGISVLTELIVWGVGGSHWIERINKHLGTEIKEKCTKTA